MSIKRYENGAWKDCEGVKRYENGTWQDCESVKRYENGAWINTWENYQPDFFNVTHNGLWYQGNYLNATAQGISGSVGVRYAADYAIWYAEYGMTASIDIDTLTFDLSVSGKAINMTLIQVFFLNDANQRTEISLSLTNGLTGASAVTSAYKAMPNIFKAKAVFFRLGAYWSTTPTDGYISFPLQLNVTNFKINGKKYKFADSSIRGDRPDF